MIVVVGLEQFRGFIDGFASIVKKICDRFRNVDEIIGSRVMDILPKLLHLEVHCFRFI